MPRTDRVVLPNYAHHIVQRGHNRQVVFAVEDHYLYYLDTLKAWKETYGIKVYGYCLMKCLAGRQTRYVNRLEGRRGTLWEGRYKSSPIQTDEYLLACCRYTVPRISKMICNW